jgi:hypothetical protein
MANGADTPERLQACLRPDFPGTVVTNGIVDRGAERWYAYREGYWVSSIFVLNPAEVTP